MRQLRLFPDDRPVATPEADPPQTKDRRDADSTAIGPDGCRFGYPRNWWRDRASWQNFVRLLHAKRNGRQAENEVASAVMTGGVGTNKRISERTTNDD